MKYLNRLAANPFVEVRRGPSEKEGTWGRGLGLLTDKGAQLSALMRTQVLLDDISPWLWHATLLLAATINLIMISTWCGAQSCH